MLALALLALVETAVAQYYSRLKGLRSSEGFWDAQFRPNLTQYQVHIEKFVPELTIQAEVNFERYLSSEFYPVITANGEPVIYTEGQPAVHTLELGGKPQETLVKTISVEVASPDSFKGPKASTTYRLIVTRDPDESAALLPVRLELEDELYNLVELQPAFKAMSHNLLYSGKVSANAQKLRLQFACNSPATAEAEVSGKMLPSSGDTVDAWVVPDESGETDITVDCVWQGKRHSIELSLQSTVDLAKADIKLEVIGGTGTPEDLGGNDTFSVLATDEEVRLVALYEENGLLLDFEEEAGGRRFALGAGVPTPPIQVPPLPRTKEVFLLLHSAQEERRISVRVRAQEVLATTIAPGPSHAVNAPNASVFSLQTSSSDIEHVGVAVSGFLAALCGVSTILMLNGEPLDVPPLLRWLLLPVQLLVLSEPESFQASGRALSSLAQGLRYTCLQHPPERAESRPSRPGEGTLWSGRRLASMDVEATWSLRACAATLAAALGAHVLLLAARVLLPVDCHCRRYTVPHRWRLGAWELHLLMLLALPMSWSCMIVLMERRDLASSIMASSLEEVARSDASLPALAAVLLAASCLGGFLALCQVLRATVRHDILWMPEDTGSLKRQQDFGRYCDTRCDQLTSRIHEASWRCCASLLPLRWAATVADVVPVRLVPRNAGRKLAIEEDEDSEGQELLRGEAEGPGFKGARISDDYAQVQPDKEVDVQVLTTVVPSQLWAGLDTAQVGFYSELHWLKALFGPKSLAHFHHEMQLHVDDWTTPLRVRVDQLQGPITNSWLAFCFDGQRWPLLPAVELLFRLGLGVLWAQGERYGALLISSCLCCGMFACSLWLSPSTSYAGNLALTLSHLACAIISLAHLSHCHGMAKQEADMAVLVAACLVLPIAVAATLRLLALLVASLCPRAQVEDCNVDLGLVGPGQQWLLQVPAECSVPIRESFLVALGSDIRLSRKPLEKSRPRLEFQALDYVAKVGPLEPPLAVLFGPGDGNSHYSEIAYADEERVLHLSINVPMSRSATRLGADLRSLRATSGRARVSPCHRPKRPARAAACAAWRDLGAGCLLGTFAAFQQRVLALKPVR
ncbi:unnamed protein product [Effrenium voratum]|nr:unnamed protein product [Effrenium voratum]